MRTDLQASSQGHADGTYDSALSCPVWANYKIQPRSRLHRNLIICQEIVHAGICEEARGVSRFMAKHMASAGRFIAEHMSG